MVRSILADIDDILGIQCNVSAPEKREQFLPKSDIGRHLFDFRQSVADVCRVGCLWCCWLHFAPLEAAIGLQVVQLVFWLAPNAWSITKEAAWFGRFVAISGIVRWTTINLVSCHTHASREHHLILKSRS